MKVNVVPAVLEFGLKKTQAAINRLITLRAGIHLDILDGSIFGPTKNLIPEDFAHLRFPRRTSVHLMVKHPTTWLRACYAAGIERVVLQAESELSPHLLREARRYFRFVIALAPSTPVSRLHTLAPYAEGFQIMTVQPGRQGRPFIPKQLHFVQQLRQRWPRSLISVDGGIGPKTVVGAVTAGANELIVGSHLRSSKHPAKTYKSLVKLAQTAAK